MAGQIAVLPFWDHFLTLFFHANMKIQIGLSIKTGLGLFIAALIVSQKPLTFSDTSLQNIFACWLNILGTSASGNIIFVYPDSVKAWLPSPIIS
jgi:hypothetical protein